MLYDLQEKPFSNSFKGKKLACCFHCHSDQSVDGASTVESLVKRMADFEYTHVTLTEHGTLGSAAAVHRIVNGKKLPLKVIHGVEGYLYWPGDDKPKRTYHITIFFKTRQAFEAYCKLTPALYSPPRVQSKAADWKPCMTWEDFLTLADTKAIVIGTGCVGSWLNKPIADSGDLEEAKRRMAMMVAAVGAENIYDEWIVDDLSYRHVRSPEPGVADQLLMDECRPWFHSPDIGAETNRVRWEYVSKPLGVKRVASQDSHYARRGDKVIQDNKRWSFGLIMPYLQHLKSTEEYAQLALQTQKFAVKDAEELIDNTSEFVTHFDKYEFLTQRDRGFLIPKHSEDPRAEIMKRIAEVGNVNMNDPVYRERIEYELSVLQCEPKYDGASYMLMASDIANMARENGILTNVRGCLTGDSLVLTSSGYKEISAVRKGEYVATLSGNYRKVLKIYEYDVDENLLSIHARYSFGPLKLTRDHKVYACKRKITHGHNYEKFSLKDFDWLRADELVPGDLLFTPWLTTTHSEDISSIDLADFSESIPGTVVSEDVIRQEIPVATAGSLRTIARSTGLSRNAVKDVFCRKLTTRKATQSKVHTYLQKNGIPVQGWYNSLAVQTRTFTRFLDLDEELCYFFGKWIGDGWLRTFDRRRRSYECGIAFFSEDTAEIERTLVFLRSKGVEPAVRKAKGRRLVQLSWTNPLWYRMFQFIFPDYRDSSSKSFGRLLNLPERKLWYIVKGLYSSDGSVCKSGQRESYDTTSPVLARQIKEVLLKLRQPCTMFYRSPYVREQNGKRYECAASYKINSKGIETDFLNNQGFVLPEGYVSPVFKIRTCTAKKVYDIHVDHEHNYLTSSGIVHNSGAGSLTAYGIGLSITDSIQYGLQFERFLTAGRIKTGSVADFDNDFSNKDRIMSLLKEKYGDAMLPISIDTLLKPKMAIKDLERHFLGHVRPETELMCVQMEGIAQGVETEGWLFGYTNDDGEHVDGEMDKNPTLKAYALHNPEIWEAVLRMCGVMRQKSVHASGVIIAPEPVQNLMPVIRVGKSGEDQLVTAYGPKDVEYVGLPKLDILGVAKMAVIEECLRLIKERHGLDLTWDHLPEDEAVYKAIYWTGQTSAVFQGTEGIADLCQKCKPTSIEELSNLIALYRPGCLDAPAPVDRYKNMVDYYVAVKQGQSKPVYIHPDMAEVFGLTEGVPLFQEQTLKAFRDWAGYTYETAEAVRRGISKKDKKLIDEHCGNLKKSLVDRGWSESQAKMMEDVVVASARYSFNACVSGDEVIARPNKSPIAKGVMTIRDMYLAKTDKAWAKKNGREQVGKKYRLFGYGKSLSRCPDGRVRPNEIVDIRAQGVKPILLIECANGATCRVTENHKIPTLRGELRADELIVGDGLYFKGDYEQNESPDYTFKQGMGTNNPQKGQHGFQKKDSPQSKMFEAERVRRMISHSYCDRCSCEVFSDKKPRGELHHIDLDRSNNASYNLELLCASCHKKVHYIGGRTRRGEKGYPTITSPIVRIESTGEVVDVYDVEMKAPAHNFALANGMIICNSHSTSYANVSYRTAFLKHFYPIEYWCAELTVETLKGTNEEKLQQYGNELRHMIAQPDVTKSHATHWVINGNKLVAPMLALKGAGEVFCANLLRLVQADSLESLNLGAKKPKGAAKRQKSVEAEVLFDEYD